MMSLPLTATLTYAGGVQYYIPATCVSTAGIGGTQRQVFGNSDSPNAGPIPSAVFKVDSLQSVTADILTSVVNAWLETDDVFRLDFLSRIIFLSSAVSEAWSLDERLKELLQKWSTRDVFVIFNESLQNEMLLSPGPYFSLHDGLHPAWRLFPDSHEAFIFPVVPAEENDRT